MHDVGIELEAKIKYFRIAHEYEGIRHKLLRERQGTEKYDILLTHGIELQGAMKAIRDIFGLWEEKVSKEELEYYVQVKHGKSNSTNDELRNILVDLTDGLTAMKLIEKYELNMPLKDKRIQEAPCQKEA